jgi:hypothetical protein
MKSVCSICLLLVSLGIVPSLRAQDIPAAEIFGGYSYLNIDTNGLGPRQSAQGWEAALTANITKVFAAEFDVTGAYKTISPVSISDYSYVGGIRANFRPAFVHALVGGDDLRGSAFGISASQQGLAALFGGGVEFRMSRSLSLQAGADYALTRHNIFGGPNYTQNNLRFSVGISFGFGNRGPGAPRAARNVPSRAPGEEPQESILFGIAGIPAGAGVKVTLVRDQSIANRAGIQLDDVVVAINGDRVHSIRDIEIAVGKNIASGSLNVNYLTKGIASVESTVSIVPPR